MHHESNSSAQLHGDLEVSFTVTCDGSGELRECLVACRVGHGRLCILGGLEALDDLAKLEKYANCKRN